MEMGVLKSNIYIYIFIYILWGWGICLIFLCFFFNFFGKQKMLGRSLRIKENESTPPPPPPPTHTHPPSPRAQVMVRPVNCYGDFCRLLITFANYLNPASSPTKCQSWSGFKLFARRPDARKPDFVACDKKGADQLRGLISAYINRFIQSMISKLDSYVISTGSSGSLCGWAGRYENDVFSTILTISDWYT